MLIKRSTTYRARYSTHCEHKQGGQIRTAPCSQLLRLAQINKLDVTAEIHQHVSWLQVTADGKAPLLAKHKANSLCEWQ